MVPRFLKNVCTSEVSNMLMKLTKKLMVIYNTRFAVSNLMDPL